MTFKQEALRAKAIEVMAKAIWNTAHAYDGGISQAAAAFDALHGIVLVTPLEATPIMLAEAWSVFNRHPHEKLTPGPGFKEALQAMAAAGDLTKSPETER